MNDLQELGLWDDDMIQKLKYYDGSVQTITEIPTELRSKYKEVFEIEPRWVVRHAAHRGKWIDQSQSVNIFTTSTSGKLISEIYMDAWKMGLKTTYYLRTMGASSIEKATLDQKSQKFVEAARAAVMAESVVPEAASPASRVADACSLDDPTCEACQ